MKPGERYWARVEKVWDAISIYDGPDVFLSQFGAASVVARNLFVGHWCQSEVNNGGHHQFFFNSTGVLAPEAIAAFRTIGLPDIASVVEKAASKLGSPYPRARHVRQLQLDLLTGSNKKPHEVFAEFDDTFYAIWKGGDAWDALADAYASADA